MKEGIDHYEEEAIKTHWKITSMLCIYSINIPLNSVGGEKVIALENNLGLKGESARLEAVKVNFLGDY